MTEFVVTLRNGRRVDVEAAEYEHAPGGSPSHRFMGAEANAVYSDDLVLLVQRRNGHLLEQLWPEATDG